MACHQLGYIPVRGLAQNRIKARRVLRGPMMHLKRNQKGFTLIELLVVIAMLAVLAAVAIPAYSRFFGHGEEEANLAELANVQVPMDAMLAQNGLGLVDARLATGTDDF